MRIAAKVQPAPPPTSPVEQAIAAVVREHLAAGRSITLSPASNGGVSVLVGNGLCDLLRQVLREEFAKLPLALPRVATAEELAQLPPEAMIAKPNPSPTSKDSEVMYYTSKEVMTRLRYKQRGPFWDCVRREAIPHRRINSRVIRFPVAAFEAWFQSRESTT